MTAYTGDIQMFRLKPLSSAIVPQRWVVIYFNQIATEVASFTYRDGCWSPRGTRNGYTVTVLDVAEECRRREVTWVICNDLYAWLCSQGFYHQITTGKVSLPMGNSSSNNGKLTGQFVVGDPCIIDLEVGEKRLHCVDFCNFGIDEVQSIKDAVQRLSDYVRLTVGLDLGSLKSTAAAQGSCRYRTHDMLFHRLYCHQMKELRQLERDAFYGGRAECKTIGKITEPTYHMDAISMHPTIGMREKFPTKLIDFGPGEYRKRMMSHYRDGKHIIAKVELETPTPDYPYRCTLPGDDNRPVTIYPIGPFTTTLCHPEFSHALERDRVKRVVFWAAYDCDAIFRLNSMSYFSAKDRLGGLGLSHMKGSLKLVQNSLYGHLGRRGRRWIDGPKWTDAEWGMWWGRHPIHNNVVTWRAVYGVHQYLDSGLEPENSIPAISATMFSYSRMYLLDLIEAAGWKKTHYYDTDGVVTNYDGYCYLNHPVHNCKLKEQSSDVDIRGIKYYRFGPRWVHAGVPGYAERHSDGSASFEKHEPFNYGMWHGTPFQHKFILAKNDPYPKYRHGVVGSDGRVSPYSLPFKE
jgi:hypothetical protein